MKNSTAWLTQWRRKFLLFAITGFYSTGLYAQDCSLTTPQLFGLAPSPGGAFIYCKNTGVGFGVNGSSDQQIYTFAVYQNNIEVGKKGGPLDGNGGQLSVAAAMTSARDVGEYRITTNKEGCPNTAQTNFYAFYGSIDNLSISAWGSNAVSFLWASCGPKPAITYKYAVTTIADPNSGSITYSTTTDTFASRASLVNGTTYYIHVRVEGAVWNGNTVDQYFNGCSGGDLPWTTIRFVACSAAVPVGNLNPTNGTLCTGGTATLTASGGTGYKWFREDNSEIIGATSPTYAASTPGQYKSWILTGTTCQGMVNTATVVSTSLQAGVFSGTGMYYPGDTVSLGISETIIGQTYKILKGGVEVYSAAGIGRSQETFTGIRDTIFYKFVISSPAQAGLYTVRTNNPFCNPIDFGSVSVALVNESVICSGSSTSFTVPSQGAGYTYQWQVNTGSGFTNVSNGAPYAGATTRTLTITAPPAAFNGYIYRNVATGPGTVTSSTRTLKFGVTWTGATSTAWNVASNWNCGSVPGATTDVVIPAGMPRYPSVTSSLSCKSINIRPGATLTTAPGVILTVTGQ